MWQAGHTEKCIALYQAMLEFNLFLPDVLQNVDNKDQQEFFETFWDSGMPRVGEDEAQGWAAWVENKGEGHFASMNNKGKITF